MTVRNVLSPDDKRSRDLQRWLVAGESFVVQAMHADGYAVTGYTARCEQAKDRQARRWYGYKRVSGRLVKRYLGRTEDITWELLQSALDRFVQNST